MLLLNSKSINAMRQEAKSKFEEVMKDLASQGKALIEWYKQKQIPTAPFHKPYPFGDKRIYTLHEANNSNIDVNSIVEAFTNKNINLDCLEYFLNICNNVQNVCFTASINPNSSSRLHYATNNSIASDGYHFFPCCFGVHILEFMSNYSEETISLDDAMEYLNRNDVNKFRKWIIPINGGKEEGEILIYLAVLDFDSSTISFLTPAMKQGETVNFEYYYSALIGWVSAVMDINNTEFVSQQWSYFKIGLPLSSETDKFSVVINTCFLCYHILFNMPIPFGQNTCVLHHLVAGVVLPIPENVNA